MDPANPPLILEPDQLEPLLGSEGLSVVDLGKSATFAKLHIPGAVHIDYARIVASHRPVAGLLPPAEQLEQVLGRAGINQDSWVVAYDDEGGGNASRLLWTLDALGHERASLLNGGLHAWANEGHPVDTQPAAVLPQQYRARPQDGPVADRDFIERHLGNPDLALVDARSPEEFTGQRRFAARGGHIPGAVSWDWLNAVDRSRNLRLKPEPELRAALGSLNVGPEQQVVTYCQTHHRSSLIYIVLKSLGYRRVKGYHGSWSDWGNQPDTAIET